MTDTKPISDEELAEIDRLVGIHNAGMVPMFPREWRAIRERLRQAEKLVDERRSQFVKLCRDLTTADKKLKLAEAVVSASEALRCELELAEPSQAPTHFNVWYLFTGALEAYRKEKGEG